MKAFLCLPVAVLVVSLSGCATDSRFVAKNDSKYDEAYIAKVEQLSRARGVTVKWMNPPARKKQAVDDEKSD